MITTHSIDAQRAAQRPDLALDARCGALVLPEGGVQFRIWAPGAEQVEVILESSDGAERAVLMRRAANGHHEIDLEDLAPGQRYRFRVDRKVLPDPCSMFQPDGVRGASAVFDPRAFSWTDHDWRGVPRAGLIIYELHVGTFTPEGTFDAIIDRLQDLQNLGVTAIEIMPIAQFPGDRNWGYDGVLPYAAQNTYGGPRGLQRLVDAAHARGIAVILDVVYNHFGPEGNHLRDVGPYFTHKYNTPWGDAINYDDRGCDGVRAFILHNARMWLESFRLDGLRLDAVHAIYDLGATHILREIRDVADEVARAQNREIHIIAESDANDPRVVSDPSVGGYGMHAQWADDFHHAVHALLTGERTGYYMDYGAATQVGSVLNSPFLFQGNYSEHRGRRHGAPPTGITGDRFVVCIQNHDQVGNRAIGDRLSTQLADDPRRAAKLRLASSLLLLSPYIPMLFMGEEYGETNPFPFFCSFESAELIEAVRQGRRREFADFVSDPDAVPDPTDRATFESARLSWDWTGAYARQCRALYQRLLQARRSCPALLDYKRHPARPCRASKGDPETLIELTRGSGRRGEPVLRILFNLGDRPVTIPRTLRRQDVLLFSSEWTDFGGPRDPLVETFEAMGPFECCVLGETAWRNAFIPAPHSAGA